MNTYVKDTGTVKGRGVFAARSFKADELVEEVIVIPFQYGYDLLPVQLRNVLFSWHSVKGQDWHAIALGNGSLFNHSNPANMRAEINGDKETISFFARRDIEVDEELTINYNDFSGVSSHNNWFEAKGIQVI